jgi:hypothetical protein
MTLLTLQEIIEEVDVRQLVCRVIIGGAVIPMWTAVSYEFQIGQVPTATITIPNRTVLPSAVKEEASVQIWLGFRSGVTELLELVFGGAVVDSIGNNGSEIVIDCVMNGPRKLSYSYNRRINYNFAAVIAEDTVIDLLDLAGVPNYYVDLAPWVLGTAAPQTIQFSTYGEAINKIAEVDGSPWYALPSGQVRVEQRDPIPSPTARRIYFTNILTGPYSTPPSSIANQDAKPRINDIQRRTFRSEVANFITVDGAVITTLGPNGEKNSNQITETVDGLSGQFPNGAYWIPTPPLFQDFSFSNELVDTFAKAFEVAMRYFDLKNRLFEKVQLSIPVDPDVFLGSTVKLVDPKYSGVESLYFVEGYRTSIDEGGAATELQLTGGPHSGTTGFAAPFAEFWWTYEVLHEILGGGEDNYSDLDLGPLAQLGGKFCEDLPAEIGTIEQGGDLPPTEDKLTVLIGLDASASKDFDGWIVTYRWDYEDATSTPRTLFGKRVLIAFDPTAQSSVEMTLTVTDNSGRTGTITKTIYTSANYPDAPASGDPTMNDTEFGGGVGLGECTEDGLPDEEGGDLDANREAPGACSGMLLGYFVAAETHAMGTLNNRDWNDLAPAAAGAEGAFRCVAAVVNFGTQQPVAIFGTSVGEVVVSNDICQTGQVVFTVPGGAAIEVIVIDRSAMGQADQGNGSIPVYTLASPGTMTITEAYQQCLAVGFEPAQAVIAVAIMIGESGLVSNASNSIGNTPPSTDRGIVQINSYWHSDVSDGCAYNTACAIGEMYRISSGGSDFTPWAVFNQGVYRQHLSQVQEEIGIVGEIGDSEKGFAPSVSRSFRVWLGTADGQLYVSYDSGMTWQLWRSFGDGYPIKAILTDRRLSHPDAPALAVFGGNSGDRGTLIRLASDYSGNFESVFLIGDIGNFLDTFSGGIVAAALNRTALILVFSNGAAWVSSDPIGDPAWVQATGLSGTINAAAPGYEGEFLLAGSAGVFSCTDNVAFSQVGSPGSAINHLIWQGLPGKYLAAANGGLYTTIDRGETWGFLRPNSEFGTTWPEGAIGNRAAFAVGPRECPPPPSPSVFIGGASFGSWEYYGNTGDPTARLAASGAGVMVYINTSPSTTLWLSTDYGVTWQAKATGFSVADMDVSANNVLFTSFNDTIRRSTNLGDSWSIVKTANANDLFLQPIAVHPTDGNRIAVGFRETKPFSEYNYGVYVSTNGGNSWTRRVIINGDLTNQLASDDEAMIRWHPNGKLVYALQYHVLDTFDDGIGIFVSDDDGASWTKVLDDRGAVFAAVRQIVLDQPADYNGSKGAAKDNGIAFLFRKGGGTQHIYSSSDAETWVEEELSGITFTMTLAYVGGKEYLMDGSGTMRVDRVLAESLDLGQVNPGRLARR